MENDSEIDHVGDGCFVHEPRSDENNYYENSSSSLRNNSDYEWRGRGFLYNPRSYENNDYENGVLRSARQNELSVETRKKLLSCLIRATHFIHDETYIEPTISRPLFIQGLELSWSIRYDRMEQYVNATTDRFQATLVMVSKIMTFEKKCSLEAIKIEYRGYTDASQRRDPILANLSREAGRIIDPILKETENIVYPIDPDNIWVE